MKDFLIGMVIALMCMSSAIILPNPYWVPIYAFGVLALIIGTIRAFK